MTYNAHPNRYDDMIYRRVGLSGMQLPVISLGLWHHFGEATDHAQKVSLLTKAFDMGITHFDLANNYGPPPGSAESAFGKVIGKELVSYRDEIIVSSKAGYMMWPGPYGEWGSRKYLIASCDQSLERTGLDYFDIFYSHRFDPDTPLEETMLALDHIVRSGRALYVGISSYYAEQTAQAAEILSDLGTPCLIHQPAYSMVNRWIEEDELELSLRQHGMGAIVFSPLAQGLLSDKYLAGIPHQSRAKTSEFFDQSQLNETTLSCLKSLNEVAAERGQTLAQMAIAWVLRNDVVASAIIGPRTEQQLLDCIQTIKHLQFSFDELFKIDQILNRMKQP